MQPGNIAGHYNIYGMFMCITATSYTVTSVPIVLHTVPIPTFILGPQSTEHAQYFEKIATDGGELCENITCLGNVLLKGFIQGGARGCFCPPPPPPWDF